MSKKGYGKARGGFEVTGFIRDPFTGKTFTLKDWEIEKQRRKEQMAKEYHERHNNTKNHKKKILFVYKQENKGFIRTDYEILSRHYDVTYFHYKGIKSVPKLFWLMRKYDLIFVWFISLHTFFVSFTKTPKVFVAGGYDVANEPEINYGLARGEITKWIVKRCINRADKILTVSKASTKDLVENFGSHSNVEMIYNCPDTDLFVPNGKKDENLIITVGGIDKGTWVRKGIANFVNIAHFFNEMGRPHQFIVIGKIADDMKERVKKVQSKISNLKFTGFVSNEELLDYYQRAKVYCQLSYYESYGLAVSEAMLCECVPVVSNRTALPEVVGDVGFKVDISNMADIRIAIEEALRMDGGAGREFTLKFFNIDRREKELVSTIEDILI